MHLSTPPPLVAGDSTMILILSLCATFVNGLGGGLTGVRARLDAFGVAALAVASGLGGSVTRDLLIGRPPAAFRDWRYLAVLGGAGLVTLLAFPLLDRARRAIAVLDAAGLSLFAVTGASIALDHRLAAPEAVLLGAISGVGGVVLRDVLIREVPLVLRGGLSAISALVGASIVVIGVEAGGRDLLFALLGSLACFSIRIAADHYDWNLPPLPYHPRPKRDAGSSSQRDVQRDRQPAIEPDGDFNAADNSAVATRLGHREHLAKLQQLVRQELRS
jgi:uncharacterized membrane protein YeiH